jgi:hypothetical protein
MNVRLIKITPLLAKEILQRNTGNRKIDWPWVRQLAREMTLGRWETNGVTVSWNDEKLIDGQHRLLAVVESGVTVEMLVVEGLPSDVFDTIDIGKRRTAADTLSVRGETQCKNLAAALIVVDRYMTGRVGKQVRYTNTEIEELLNKYPEVRRSVRACSETKKLVAKSVLTGCHYLFAKKDDASADQFVHQLISGSGIIEGDPVYVLRERILQNSLAKAKLSGDYLMAIIIKAWNHKRAGRSVRCLRYREEGETPEAFPVVA